MGSSSKEEATSFADLARRVPKSYQKMAENSAAELNRLLEIDEAGNVRSKNSRSTGVAGQPAIAAEHLLSFLTTKRKSQIR